MTSELPAVDLPLAERAAQRSLTALQESRRAEAQRLMAAGMAVMTRLGQSRRATVAEIVAEAGLSNQAFYRHFGTKDDLVAALVDDGARRLADHLSRRMSGIKPKAAVRLWIRGVLAQATVAEVAAPTKAVAFNRTALVSDAGADARAAERLVWQPLIPVLAQLGVRRPEAEARLIGALVLAVLDEALSEGTPPTPADLDAVEDFCLRRLG